MIELIRTKEMIVEAKDMKEAIGMEEVISIREEIETENTETVQEIGREAKIDIKIIITQRTIAEINLLLDQTLKVILRGLISLTTVIFQRFRQCLYDSASCGDLWTIRRALSSILDIAS
jgi:hypothetical protein